MTYGAKWYLKPFYTNFGTSQRATHEAEDSVEAQNGKPFSSLQVNENFKIRFPKIELIGRVR